MEVLWPMDHAVDGGEGQPEPELGPGDSYGVHSWIEGASADGRQVSWFAPQNQVGGWRLKMPIMEARASVSGLAEEQASTASRASLRARR